MPPNWAWREPVTVTTVKPAGTTSKLFGLTEGAHLPARRHYLRWVQFKGTRDADGAWAPTPIRCCADYWRERGYPMRTLNSFPGMTIVGFPTEPLLLRLGLDDALVTAPEAVAGRALSLAAAAGAALDRRGAAATR